MWQNVQCWCIWEGFYPVLFSCCMLCHLKTLRAKVAILGPWRENRENGSSVIQRFRASVLLSCLIHQPWNHPSCKRFITWGNKCPYLDILLLTKVSCYTSAIKQDNAVICFSHLSITWSKSASKEKKVIGPNLVFDHVMSSPARS